MKGRFPNLWATVATVAIVLAAAVWAAVSQLKASVWVNAISAAVAAAAGAGGTLLLNRLQSRKERQGKLRENLRFWQPPNARLLLINDVDPFRLRITPSELASEAAGQGEAAPYVPRDQDRDVERALRTKPFVLVIGESKAGKSRSAFHAAQVVYPKCPLVVPERRESLQILSTLDPPLDLSHSVVWLDDLEGYLGSDSDGLTSKVLETCEASQVHILATMRTTEFEKYADQRVARGIREVLDRAETIRLKTTLSSTELDAARKRFPRANEFFLPGLKQYGLGAYLLAGPDLVRRFENQEGEAGSSIVRAAIDWRRAGLTRPVPQPLLFKLYPIYLRPGREATEEKFAIGLNWAREEIYPMVALLSLDRPVPPLTFKAFDYIVDHVTRQAPAVPRATWDLVLDSTQPDEGFQVGVSATTLEEGDVAERAFARAANAGNRDAANNLGVVLEERNDLKGAEDWYRKAAAMGELFAAYNLGVMLDDRRDYDEAEKWYRKAADAGDPDAQNNLGNILDDRGQSSEAEALYRKAAESGLGLASHNLAVVVEARGDRKEAENWYRQAALRGEVDDAYQLAGMLEEDGELDEADTWYAKAAEAGLPDAMNDLALLLDTKRDSSGAEAWFKKAAAAGQPEAAYNLGILFEDRRDLAEAEKWYQQAIALGDPDAADRLAALRSPA